MAHSPHQAAVHLSRHCTQTWKVLHHRVHPESFHAYMFLPCGKLHLLRAEECQAHCSHPTLSFYPWGAVTYVRKWKLVGMKFLLQEQAKTTAEIYFPHWILQSCRVVPAHRTERANLLCKRQWPLKAGCDWLVPHFAKTISSKAESSGQGDFVGTNSAIPFSRWRADISQILGDTDQWHCTYMQWNPDNPRLLNDKLRASHL